MESIEVDGAVFSPDAEASFDDQASAFAAFVMERDLSTEYALYGAVIGSPQRGVDEIHGVLVDAGDWVSFHRNAGHDSVKDGVVTSVTGMSEAPMRNMFKAWDEYMRNGA